MNEAKPWYLSKAIMTSGVAFAVALATASGVVDTETGAKVEGLLIPLVLAFMRAGNKEIA